MWWNTPSKLPPYGDQDTFLCRAEAPQGCSARARPWAVGTGSCQVACGVRQVTWKKPGVDGTTPGIGEVNHAG